MDISGDEENCAHQKGTEAADDCNRTASGKTIQVCLMPVRYDQYPEDQESDRFAG
jgi:hypothetical protein